MPIDIKSSLAETDYASKNIDRLNLLLKEHPPFYYVVYTDTRTNLRELNVEQNERSLFEVKTNARVAINCMKVAIEQAYFALARPVTPTEIPDTKISFPISKSKEDFDKAITNSVRCHLKPDAINCIKQLRPYPDMNGNKLLYTLHQLDNIGKHRFPPPTGEYAAARLYELRAQIFDSGFMHEFQQTPDITFAGHISNFSYSWPYIRSNCFDNDIGDLFGPSQTKFKKVINTPVTVSFDVGEINFREPVITSLNSMLEATKEIVNLLAAL